MQENKYDDDIESDDDDYKEVVVNNSDFRAEIYEFPHVRDLPIIKCIGQIQSEYDYQIENEYKVSGVGTGTVYQVSNNVAFVISCAHNIRHKIYECPQCHIYNKKKSCLKCTKTLNSSYKQLLVPTHIEFKRRNIADNNFGRVEQTYTCEEIFVPVAYEQNAALQKGFDFAVLMFRDNDGYYLQHCRDVKLDVGTDVLKTHKRFCMFGYPGIDFANAKKNKLYGYAMKSDAKLSGFELKECEEPNGNFQNQTKYVVRQRQIDASAGQSGSVVFVVSKTQAIVFSVHVGGHEKKKGKLKDYSYNVATLLSEEYIKILDNVTDVYSQNIAIRLLTHELDLVKEKNATLAKKLIVSNEKKNKQNIVSLQNEIEMLKNENNKLKKELIISNDKIMCLQMVSNEPQKQKNNVFNEEKKPNKNYGVPAPSAGIAVKRFSWGIYGPKMKINGTKVIFNGVEGWNTVYSNTQFSKQGKNHIIKLKVLQKSKANFIAIGITATTNNQNHFFYGKNGDYYNYGYRSDGFKFSHEDGSFTLKNTYNQYYEDDIISVGIDLNDGRMWCDKNNKKNVYETNIKKKTGKIWGEEIKYYLAISMGGAGSAAIEIV